MKAAWSDALAAGETLEAANLQVESNPWFFGKDSLPGQTGGRRRRLLDNAAFFHFVQNDWLNTVAFYTDPDAVCVREPLSLELARLWATLVGLTGQLLMSSDRMYALPDARVELLRRIYPVADIHPMELYPLDTRRHPGIFDVKVDLPGVGRWDVVGLFNWSETAPRIVELTPKRLGLDGDAWLCLDGWTGELIHDGDGCLAVKLPPLSSRVVSCRPRLGHPQVVGSNRHLTQGAVDLVSVAGEAGAGVLSGVSRVVGGEPYRLRLYVPAGYRCTTPACLAQGGLHELTLHSPHNAELSWRVSFRGASPVDQPRT